VFAFSEFCYTILHMGKTSKFGRPKLDPKGRQSVLVAVRLPPAEHRAYKQEAKRSGQNLSEWIRGQLGGIATQAKAAERRGVEPNG
jgi:predicted HicB family RNase H-like nuclease